MSEFSLATPESILGFVREINDDNFKICLDVGHVATFRDLCVEDEIRRLGSEIKVLHIHDNEVGPDMHLLPFDGRIEWEKVALALKETGFDGVFSIELHVPGKAPATVRDDWFRLIYKLADVIIN